MRLTPGKAGRIEHEMSIITQFLPDGVTLLTPAASATSLSPPINIGDSPLANDFYNCFALIGWPSFSGSELPPAASSYPSSAVPLGGALTFWLVSSQNSNMTTGATATLICNLWSHSEGTDAGWAVAPLCFAGPGAGRYFAVLVGAAGTSNAQAKQVTFDIVVRKPRF